MSNKDSFEPSIARILAKLRKLGISSRVDSSSVSIGKRYARNDELGTPLGVTVDFQSLEDNTVTLRDRDTTKQVRSDEDTICKAIKELSEGEKTWADISKELPSFTEQQVAA